MVDESVQEFRVQQWGTVQVVHFLVDALLDPLDVQRIDDCIQELLGAGEAPRVLLDLGPLEHVSSMMLATLVKGRTLADERGGVLLVARAHPRLQALLESVRLTDLFELHDTVEGAIKSLEE